MGSKLQRHVHLSKVFHLLVALALVCSASGGGTVTNCMESQLHAALTGGGTVLFTCGGTITLTSTINITQDTIIDGNGFTPVISGGNAIRLLTVSSNVTLQIKGLTLSDGWIRGATGIPPAVA